MGLGGYLTWTAAAREIKKRTGMKSFPFEQHGSLVKPITSEIFQNNPNIWQLQAENQPCVPLQLNNPDANYCKKDTPSHAFHRKDKHIIQQVCEVYGILDPELKCDIFLTPEEEYRVHNIVRSIRAPFVTIEPYSNTDYTPNRAYPRKHWQSIVDSLARDIAIVQVGNAPFVLDGVIDLRNVTTFREACGVIGQSKLFISTEGGLVHGATAFGTKSIVLLTSYQDPRMVSYPQNENIFIGSHDACGSKVLCGKCVSDAENHDPMLVLKRVQTCLTD